MWHVFHSSCLCLNELREDCDQNHSSDLSALFQNYRCLWPPVKPLCHGHYLWVKGQVWSHGAWWGRCLLWVHQRHRSWLALRVPSTTGTEYWGSDWPLYLWWNESVVGSSWKERCGHVDGFYMNASSKDAKVKICWLEIWLFSCKCKMLNVKIRILECKYEHFKILIPKFQCSKSQNEK